MWEWLLIAVLYLVPIVFFRLIGGVGSAEEALRRWGEATARRKRPLPPVSSGS